MYESFFAFDQRPFQAAPLPIRFFPGRSIEAARLALTRCLERAAGSGLVIGPAGTGKTLLCYRLAEQFKGQYSVVTLFGGHLGSRRDLLQAIQFELGQPYRGMEEGELRLALIDYLTRSEQCPQGMVLLVDEAHALPLKLLEEVRMITNLVRNGQPRVRLALFGGPVLEERFASPKLESFSQRLAARCYLEGLDRSETLAYIRYHVAAVGGDGEQVFRPEALDAVYRATDGIPRLINQVCDHALLLACSAGVRQLSAREIDTAWADLQQLPSPWSAGDPSAGLDSQRSGTVIEYGSLDEDPIPEPSPDATQIARRALPEESNRHDRNELLEDSPIPAGTTALIQQTDERLDQLEDSMSMIRTDQAISLTSLPEVELVFDDPIEDIREEQPVLEPSFAESESFTLTPAESFDDEHGFVLGATEFDYREGDAVIQDEPVEEVVIDRYAALDAIKGQGTASRPRPSLTTATRSTNRPSRTAARTESKISHSAEKNLSLAEALVRHATTVEQANLPANPAIDSMFSVVETAAGDRENGAWLSIDLIPPGAEDSPTEPAAIAPSAVQPCISNSERIRHNARAYSGPIQNIVEADDCEPQISLSISLPMDAPQAAAAQQQELELIVVEEDPQEVVESSRPQAAPVRKQEYRQLFAKLRKG